MAESNELGRFLRSRREHLTPADVGLRDTGRRRTPGLRREEVAAIAGLSIDYLVRLEQGRDRRPSAGVITALAAALRLDPDERLHLAKLAACAGEPELCPTGSGAVDDVAPSVRQILDRLDPTPAVVIGPWYQVLAYNGAWARIMQPTGALDGASANLARYVFLDDRARQTFPDWTEVADEQVATLRDSSVRWRHDSRMLGLLDELLTVPEFAQRWQVHDVARKRRGTKRIAQPVVGELRVNYEVLSLVGDNDHQLIAWLPADDATAAALDGLERVTSPPRLRVVG